MLSLGSVKNWFLKYEKYLFSYKNGYFVLPYLGNSPYTIIESFKHMPFIRHNQTKQQLLCNNIFASGKIHYQEIEQNMMLLVTSIEYKKNVTFKQVYDNSEESNYYIFSFVSNIIKNVNHNGIYDGKQYNSSVWMIIKPQNFVPTHYSAGTNCLHIDLFVSKKWLIENLNKSKSLLLTFEEFENSNKGFLVWSELLNNSNELIEPFRQAMENHNEGENMGYLKLKGECYNFLDRILKNYNCLQESNNNNINSENIDLENILLAEKLLSENIFSSFMSIETLSKKVGMSSTKLKILFKKRYGMTIFQYYQNKQMQFAFQALKTNQYQVKELALKLGYKNCSKFSSSFRKHFNVLPSELLKLNLKKNL